MAKSAPQPSNKFSQQFFAHWRSSTDDNNITLHGFRRFKTSHLLNLRFLENEIAELDHSIYQAGLSLGQGVSLKDRLGLRYAKIDDELPDPSVLVNQELILKLRDLLRQYDEGITAFNNIMAMETFSLLDDEKQASLRSDLTLTEIYKTRLVRVDLEPRSRKDHFQRRINAYLRAWRYWRLSRRAKINSESLNVFAPGDGMSHQNTILIAEVLGRVLMAIMMAAFLIVPLVVLCYQSKREVQLAIISVFIVLFSFLVSALLKVSNLEMMIVSAAYGAILSVFVSNTS